MKRKNLLVVLVLAITLIVLQATVLAADSKVPNSGLAGGSMTQAEFLNTKSSDKKITLVDDVTITDTNVVIASELTIDLADHDLTLSKGLLGSSGKTGVLNITGQGKITATNANNVVVFTQYGGTVNLNGCIVEATSSQRALLVQENCTATIDGGATIIGAGNKVVNVMGEGAKATLNNGSIKSTGEKACAVSIQESNDKGNSQFIMNNGTIEAKYTAVTINNIHGTKDSFNSFIMNNGEIKHSDGSNGVLIVLADAAFEMNDGTITSKTAGAAAVQVGANGSVGSGNPDGHAGKLVMNGGTVEADVENGVGIYAFAKSESETTVNINGGTIKGQETGISSNGKASVEISEDVKATTITGRYGVTAYDNSEVTITGGTINGTTAGLGTNGSDKGTDTSITVSGGNITGGIAGAYMPAGKLTVSDNAKISGKAGIVVRGGDVSVTGGTIEATGTGNVTIGDAKLNGKNYTVPAAAIIVDEAGYPQQKDGQKHVTIGEDAELTATNEGGKTLAASNNGTAIEATENGKVAPDKSLFDIQGGTFLVNGNADNANVDQFLPKDTKLDNTDGNGIVLQEGKSYLVEVDGVSYTTITEALAHAEKGDTIKLLGNIASDTLDRAPYTINKNITIDLNGKTISSEENEAVFNVGDGTNSVKFTIEDSASNGKITSSAAFPTIRVKENAELVVNGGIIENTSENSTTGAIQVSGTTGKVSKVTIANGKVAGANYGIAAFGNSEILIKEEDGKHTEVTGTNSYGIATNGSSDSSGTNVTVNGGTITGGVAGMYLPSTDGVTTITGGTITGTEGAGIVVRGGSIEISGNPEITARGSEPQKYGDNNTQIAPAALVVDKNASYGNEASANVTGGTFTATDGQPSVAYYNNNEKDVNDTENKIKISGGTFKSGTNKDEDVNNYLEVNLNTNDNGTVVVDDGTVTCVKDANGNADTTITCELINNVVEVVVSGNIAASHSKDSIINTWWAGVGFVAPEEAEKATYQFDKEDPIDLNVLESWKDENDAEHKGLSVWLDTTKEADKDFTIKITWKKGDGNTIGEVTYHVIVSDEIKMESFVAEIVGFGYDKNGNVARQAAAKNRRDNNIETDATWENTHDWGSTDKSHVMWINFKDPIPNGVTVKVDITTPNGTVETVECQGNGEYHTYAWSYTNENQTGDINVQVGDYTLTKAEAVTDENYKGGDVTVSGLDKIVEVKGNIEVNVITSGFEVDADTAQNTINTEWKKIKTDANIDDVDPNTMWVIFQFKEQQSATKYTVKIFKDEDLLRTESGNNMTNGLLIYESFNNQFMNVEPKSGVYIFNFVDENEVVLASETIEIYEVKFVIPEGLETSSNIDILTTDPDSVEKPEITGIPSGEHIEWIEEKTDYEWTYTASLVKDQTSEPSSSGSSGSSGSSKATVIAEKAKNGSVKLSKSNAKAGDSVTVTPKPDKGYSVDKVVVTDKNGKEIKVEENEDGTYTFVMPEKSAQPVKVNVTFKAEDQEQEQNQEQDHKCSSEKYNDIDQDSWYHEAIDYVIDNELMNGTSETTFNPNDTITRAMVVTILWRLDGENKANIPATFKDVLDDTWYTEAIKWAAGNKIVEGYNAEEFGTNDPITREQMAKILYSYAKYAKMDIAEGGSNLNNFADASQVSAWATESVNWAVAENLMVGANGNLNPVNTATRAEFATIIMRYCENIVEE